jgi:hypothetical protein
MRVVMAGSTMLDSWGGDVLLPTVLGDMGRVGGVKFARVMATCKRGEAHKVNVLPHLTVLLTHKDEAAWRKFVTHSFFAVQRSNSHHFIGKRGAALTACTRDVVRTFRSVCGFQIPSTGMPLLA